MKFSKLGKTILFLLCSGVVTSCVNADIPETFTTNIQTEEVVTVKQVKEEEKHSFDKYAKEREIYIEALAAYEKGDASLVRTYANNELKDYPLNVYLRFLLLQNTTQTTSQNVIDFIKSGEHTVLANRIKAYYISYYARNGRYKDVLKISPELPNATYLQCHWYNSKYHLGEKTSAINFVKTKYRDGEAFPDACNDLIGKMRKNDDITIADIKARLKASYWPKGSKKIYVNTSAILKNGKYGYDKTLKILDKLYQNPDPSRYKKEIPKNMKDVVVMAFMRFARANPRNAMSMFEKIKKDYDLNKNQQNEIAKVIIFSILYNKEDLPLDFIDHYLPEVGDTNLFEKRIRAAIWSLDYKSILRYIKCLPENLQNAENYIYWKARALENTGKKAKAMELYTKLAKERSFYGFLAAEQVGTSYALNPALIQKPDNNGREKLLQNNKAYARFQEFEYLHDTKGIKTEWQEIMNTSSIDMARNISAIEADRGYSDLAVWESIYKKDWDALSLRFPLSYKDIYDRESAKQDVDLSYLFAITRQESMMNPLATSPVGARGLMQLMPSTAKIVSKKNGIEYQNTTELYNPDVNIQLGTAYLKEMLNDFNGNRIFVTAGYNAGPHRSVKWKSKDGKNRDFVTYIETIPFDETRNYVQKVILYDYVYQYLLGVDNPVFLNDKERNDRY